VVATAARGGRSSSAPLTPPRASFALICPRRSTANRSRATARASNSIVASTGSSSPSGRYTRGARPVRSHPAMEANDHDLVRRVNLIEILGEDDEDVPPPPDDAARAWTEAQIRAYFASRGATRPIPNPVPDPRAESPLAPPSPAAPIDGEHPMDASEYPPPDDTTFRRWFPGLRRSGTECVGAVPPTMRVLCWPNAGNAEDLYTNERASGRAAPSPLLEWCRANRAECLAVQLPGRGSRLREPFLASAEDAANALFPVIASRLIDAPYVIVGHSVGSWLAFEFVRRARRAGFPAPVRAFVSAFPSPDWPEDERPWRPNRDLSEEAFKSEAREWDVNEIVFDRLWGAYHAILRADFELFDRYAYRREREGGDETPFEFPITAFRGVRDRKVTAEMVRAWSRWTREFECVDVDGGHLFPLEPDAKNEWLRVVVRRIERIADVA